VTAPFLHIGHAVNLWAMRELQEAGHKVVLLIGDFTTRIGDPTGRTAARPVIPPEQILEGCRGVHRARQELESDLTIAGTDQLFNELMGRFFAEGLGGRPQVVITTQITPGIDGRAKQSKSLGNYIALSDTPRRRAIPCRRGT
jgi:tyrosyl-tRNA synthetase